MREIERKFLIKNNDWALNATKPIRIEQGYLVDSKNPSIRVRVYGDIGYITYKKKISDMSCHEYEYKIPVEDAYQMLAFSEKTISKERSTINGWEIDKFFGKNKGLVIAEFEMFDESEEFEIPSWVGEEVTGDFKYYNVSLAYKPYKEW